MRAVVHLQDDCERSTMPRLRLLVSALVQQVHVHVVRVPGLRRARANHRLRARFTVAATTSCASQAVAAATNPHADAAWAAAARTL